MLLKGEKGDTGPQGLQGLQGPQGDQGIPGVKGASDNGSINVNVYVSGSVTAEDDLADTIAENIYIRRKRGLLTV